MSSIHCLKFFNLYRFVLSFNKADAMCRVMKIIFADMQHYEIRAELNNM